MSQEYILTKEECLAKGGHVWETGINYASQRMGAPTKNEPDYRFCKYCGHKMNGYYSEKIWEDA